MCRAQVCTSGNTVNIPDCYKDERFDQSYDKKTGTSRAWGGGGRGRIRCQRERNPRWQ